MIPDASRAYPETPVTVAVIGGGPAGSVASSWLAQQGIQTLVIERERFPRFHIGESLLPNGNAVLKAIGVWDKIQAAGFVEKRGAQFTIADYSRTIRNVFARGFVPGMEMTYQVERARFDEILLRHAEDSGATVWEEARVANAERRKDAWELTVERDDCLQRVTANWIIDASGRNCVMGRKLELPREELPYPGRMAVFNHFRGMKRRDDETAGDIIVMRLRDAWFWAIPISNDVTSVGVVAHKGAGLQKDETREAFFWRKIGESSWLSDALAPAEATGAYRVESDYSFSYQQFGDDNVLLAGDAASFIDPVFSSGVYLALESGLLAAKLISQRVSDNKPGDLQFYRNYTRQMKRRVGMMRRLIDAYYDNSSFEVFMTPRPPMGLDRAVNAILAGCLRPPFAVRWRYLLFRMFCRLNRRVRLVPKMEW